MNHKSLKHPNIIRFKEVPLTPTHLAIVMEYMQLEENFLKGYAMLVDLVRMRSELLLCNRIYTNSENSYSLFLYFLIADVWSCGVTLYVMLVEAYPFEDPKDPKKFRKTIQRILSVHYSILDYIRVSKECKQEIKNKTKSKNVDNQSPPPNPRFNYASR
ncbi:hypothetical protein CXB51_010542 [Gossypium anomalum]|uniref:non-specific serine/threonine protein kinase n=1 Tax=Gossypium anomalum TaxID=47600 RepID=A0A8J5YN05_9ROSI|nr:hypothetical protein CXB51_010542 [Gossypium anomalum]